MWDRSSMRHFGRTARMVGYRQKFREILGNIVIEDETDGRAAIPTEAMDAAHAPPAVERDWEAEFLGAKTIEEIDALEAEACAARVFTPNAAGPALHRAARKHRKALVEAAWAVDHAGPSEATGPVAMQREHPVERPAPRDFLPPQNRAERRAASRKKGCC